MRAAEFTLRSELRAKFHLVCPFLTISTPYICRGLFNASPGPPLLEVHMEADTSGLIS